MTSIFWFRQDLRLSDNAALTAALEQGPVVPVYILDDASPGEHAIGGAQRWWLHHSLKALNMSLGSKLVLRRGDSLSVLERLMAETGAVRIHATRLYEPWWQRIDAALSERITLHDGCYLAYPDSIRTGSGGRYKIFTPYWRALLERMPPAKPLPAPEKVETVTAESDKLEDWKKDRLERLSDERLLGDHLDAAGKRKARKTRSGDALTALPMQG
jgi:deoxyribodipyrimidine photo-lyase